MKKFQTISLAFAFILFAFITCITMGNSKPPFQKGRVNPTSVYPVVIQCAENNSEAAFPTIISAPENDVTLLTVLQGIVAKQSHEQLFLLNTCPGGDGNNGIIEYYQPNQQDAKNGLYTSGLFWLNYLTVNPNGPELHINKSSLRLLNYLNANDIKSRYFKKHLNPNELLNNQGFDTETWAAVLYFYNCINGYIVYTPNTNSQDLAATLCGIYNCIPVTADQVQIAQQLGLTEIANLSNVTDITSFFSQYQPYINKTFAIELIPGTCNGEGPLDYAAMLSGFVFWPDTNTQIASSIFTNLNQSIPVYGWNSASGDEGDYVNNVGENSDFVVASDNSSNLSLYSSSNTAPLPAPNNNPSKITYNSNDKYISFIISDGDNLQLVTNFANDVNWWGSQYRGEFPVGWTISPAMYYLEPDVWNYFMQSATENDQFVAGPSGIGYVYGTVVNEQQQQDYLSEFMQATGISTTCIFGNGTQDWQNSSGDVSTYIQGYLNNPAVSGAFFSQFTGWMEQTSYQTQWYNGKPVVPENIYLNPSDNVHTVAAALSTIESASNGSFFAVYAIRNGGDNTMLWLNQLNSGLEDTNIKVVLPSQLINLECQANEISSHVANN